jgi:hypothetical protein
MHLHYLPIMQEKQRLPFKKRAREECGCKITDCTDGPDRRPRPTFILKLRPQPHIDGVRALRQALKFLLRRFGLRAVEVREETLPATKGDDQ